ncbi:MAG: hypothetical protein ACKVRO_04655 [Micropepsaceae bacterium]
MYDRRIRLLAAAIGLVSATAAAEADRLNLAAGAEYSTGDYGEPQDTAVWYEFVSARYSIAPWAFKVTVPFLQIDGPATVTDDGEVEGGGVDRMVNGIGDVSLSTTYTFSWKPEKMYLDLIGRVRLPTGDDDRGLGSGEIDYSLVANLDKGFEGFNVYVEAGRRFLGSSVASPREDGWLAGAGISTDLTKETEIGASFAWREAAFEGSADPADVSAYVKHYVTPDLRVNVYALAGLSNGSPNAGGGITLTWTAYRSE